MSTRSSIVNTKSVHIFRECMSGQICIDIDGDCQRNEKYDSPTIPFEEIKRIWTELGQWIEREGEDDFKRGFCK